VVQLLQNETEAAAGPSLAVVTNWEQTVVRRLREAGD
jgi:hypothetical protein